jgi:DNA-binding GntR family transcriptional regulator
MTSQVNFETRTLTERSYEYLRKEIVGNRLPPGAVLNEVALAAQLGVSRGPVREAIRQLAAEGLVRARPRRSAVVSTLSADEFLEAYQVREALEVLAVRLAVNLIDENELVGLERLTEAMAKAAEAQDTDAFFEANTAFHVMLVEASQNKRLIAMYRALSAEMNRFRVSSLTLRGSLRRSIAEHGAIVRALRRRDADRATKLIGEHIRVPQQRLDTRDRTASWAYGLP